MEGVNGLDAGDANGFAHSSTKVDYHLNILLATHLSNPDLTPQEIAETSRSTAAAAAIVAKAARANADEKAAAAAKAVAAAKTALDLIASFQNQAVFQDNVPSHSLYSKDEELPSKLQLGDDRQGIVPNSFSSWEHKNDQCKVPIGSRERQNTEHANSMNVDFNGLGIELGSGRLNQSTGGEVAKQGIQVTRKRGRPKSTK